MTIFPNIKYQWTIYKKSSAKRHNAPLRNKKDHVFALPDDIYGEILKKLEVQDKINLKTTSSYTYQRITSLPVSNKNNPQQIQTANTLKFDQPILLEESPYCFKCTAVFLDLYPTDDLIKISQYLLFYLPIIFTVLGLIGGIAGGIVLSGSTSGAGIIAGAILAVFGPLIGLIAGAILGGLIASFLFASTAFLFAIATPFVALFDIITNSIDLTVGTGIGLVNSYLESHPSIIENSEKETTNINSVTSELQSISIENTSFTKSIFTSDQPNDQKEALKTDASTVNIIYPPSFIY